MSKIADAVIEGRGLREAAQSEREAGDTTPSDSASQAVSAEQATTPASA